VAGIAYALVVLWLVVLPVAVYVVDCISGYSVAHTAYGLVELYGCSDLFPSC